MPLLCMLSIASGDEGWQILKIQYRASKRLFDSGNLRIAVKDTRLAFVLLKEVKHLFRQAL